MSDIKCGLVPEVLQNLVKGIDVREYLYSGGQHTVQ